MFEHSTATLVGYSAPREIYRSATTVVRRAVRLHDQLRVILKHSAGAYPSLRKEAARRHELGILTALDSPHVIRGYGIARIDDRLALIEEDFGAGSLADHVADHALSVDQVLTIALQISEALAHVHAAGIIHKDISPANLLFDPRTVRIKLIDFGIASRLSRERHDARSPDGLQGTLAYISPEQTCRTNRAVDFRSDLYAFGATLYHLLTGRPPFDETSALELVHAHIAREPRPLRSLDPRIPVPLAAIVDKLMAKALETRYQSALGVCHDLQRCIDQRARGEAPVAFPLGERDVPTRFEIPQHMYGREREIAAVLAGVDAVANGGTELLLVGGYAGIGKSSLVRELHRPVVQRRGYFVSGKFDQFDRSVPYAALGQAFGQLIATVFTESAERVAAWRAQILELAGPNARMLTEIIPGLDQLIGPQPVVAELATTDLQGRFRILVHRFVRLFAQAAHPLVIFLDDLQWADNPSLQVLEILLGEARTPYLYVIAAYRDNEVADGHPFLLAVDNIRAAQTSVRQITVPALAAADSGALVAATLRRTPAQVQPLAALLHEKTGGNPFFLIQLLCSLHDRELLWFDADSGWWTWELGPILNVGITRNVVDIMTARLRRLPRACSTVLQVAACIGGSFDLKTLAQICDLPYHVAAHELWPALSEGLILCGSADYQTADVGQLDAPGDPRAAIRSELNRQLRDEIDAGRFNVRYRFLHDRVQQAAYLLTPDISRRERHLHIGRVLRRAGEAERDERIFELTRHLNLGRDLITDPDELRGLARLNLAAGQRAKSAAAHRVAIHHLSAALGLLGPDAWTDAYHLALELHKQLADCHYLVGEHADADREGREAIAHARSTADLAELYATRVQLLMTGADFAGASAAGIEGLAQLGFVVPSDPVVRAEVCAQARARVDQRLARIGIPALIDLPPTHERAHHVALELLVHTWCATSLAQNEAVAGLLTSWLVITSIEQGHTAASAVGYMLHGIAIAIEGDRARGFELGEVAMRLSSERFPHAGYAIRVGNMFAHSLNPYCRHLETNLPHYMACYRIGPQVGDLIYSSWAILLAMMLRTMKGDNLADVQVESAKYLAFVRDVKDPNIRGAYEMHRQLIAYLQDRVPAAGSPERVAFDEAERIARDVGAGFPVGQQWYGFFKTEILFVLGDYADALVQAERTEELRAYDFGMWTHTNHDFYYALAVFQAYGAATPEQRAGYDAVIRRSLARFATWSATGPDSFAHRHELLLAELARIEERRLDAVDHYDRSIALAATGRFTHDEALALELAGLCALSFGRTRIARIYLTDAYHAYARWGATAKTRLLLAAHGDLLMVARDVAPRAQVTVDGADREAGDGGLDLITVLKATQAITSEIVHDKLLTRVMAILTENAGAERGVLLLARDGQLGVEVEASAAGAELVRRPLAGDPELVIAAINLVASTQRSVLVDDAQRDPRFLGDPYVMRGRPRSVLCLPIVHKAHMHGVVYFENNLSCGVFTRDRLAVLEMLLSQAAISIENAVLYGELEDRVAERTLELRDSLDELTLAQIGLESANQALRKEIEERRQIEVELRLAQKLEAVGRLAAGIAHEINTPIQFVQDHVSFVRDGTQDLLQAIDSYRGLQVLARTDASPELAAKLDELDAETDLAFLSDRMPAALEQALYGLGRVATLVRSMKDFAHADRQGQSPSDINRALTATLAIAHNEYKYIADVRTDLGELPPVMCHISELNQCFLNLIVNASHAIADAVAHSDRRGLIEVTSRIEDGTLVVAISDSGTGIPLEIRDKLFEPFFTTKPIGQGTGQGLAIARSVIDKHGGSLSFETELGRGTTFYIRLPVDGAAQVTAA